MDDATALRRLLDERELEQIMVHYFDRVDANDPDGAAAHFAEDAEVEILTGKRYQGRDWYAKALRRTLEQYEPTSHHLDNFRVEVDGDRAETMAYVYAYHRMRSTGEPWHLIVRMRDRFERRDGEWLIVEHVLFGVDQHPVRPDTPREWFHGHPGRRRNDG
jgi:uncharacterized protein (TIGR02246 family)